MVKKTGNIILLLFYTCVLGAVNNQNLHINLADMQGNAINQVEVGVPFLLQVKANNIDYQDQPQGFEAWDDFAVSFYGQSNSMQMINGKTSRSTTFNHVVTAHKKGEFACAPLHITDTSGKQFFSDKVKIVVGDGTQIVHNRSHQPYVLTVDFENRSVYLGQKVSVLLRFGYQQGFNNLQIAQSPFQHFHQGFVAQQAVSGSFNIGQQEYKSQDFLMELYPEKVGTLLIPAFQASFVPERQQNMSHLFALVMGAGNVIHSQARSLEVQSLPASKEHANVSAIGYFDSMEFSLSSKQGKIGEGLVAKMVVVGDGNLEVVKAPMLELPQGLHYYEGNSNISRNAQGIFRKEFEWIVQAESAGEFSISEQKFVYFDLKSSTYKTLKSQAQKIVISGAAASAKQEKVVDESLMQDQQTQAEKLQNQNIVQPETAVQFNHFNFDFLHNSLSSQMLTWLIQFLCCLIGFLMFCMVAKRYQHHWFFMQTLKLRLQFMQSCRKKDIHGVYKTFEILMQQYGLEMNSPELQAYFVTLTLPDESFDNWKNFLTMIWEMNFAKDRASDQTDLAFSLAKQWFVIILSCCKLHRKKHAQKQIIS